MLRTPAFNPAFRVQAVPEEGLFLLSERSHFLLKGNLHVRLASLIDGRTTVDQLVDLLRAEGSPAEVYYALDGMAKKGYLVEAGSALTSEAAGFWHTLGVDFGTVERRLAENSVDVVGVGGTAREPLVAALHALNVRVDGGGHMAVVLAHDYLQPELAALNGDFLRKGRPWLLAKPGGTVLWIGPTFRPHQSACWQCLAQRLQLNRQVESYLGNKLGAVVGHDSVPSLPGTLTTACNLIALEVAKALVLSEPRANEQAIVTVDLLQLRLEEHVVVRRPQCPACGEPPPPDRAPTPVVLQSQIKHFTTDGGHRTVPPEETLQKYEHHVSSLTGAVSTLRRMSNRGEPPIYAGGHNQAWRRPNLRRLREGLRFRTAGKGVTDAQSRASGLCEALERYSGNFEGDEIRRQASYRGLGRAAVHPNECMLYSARQYERRDQSNARELTYTLVPEPFDEEAMLDWTPVWSLTAREFRYLPTGYCYYDYPYARGTWFCTTDSNGNAAGNTLEEAILQGFLELVERDSVALWWYNRLRRPSVDLDGFDDPHVQRLREHFRSLDRDLWVLDVTSDLGIPTFVAVARRYDGQDHGRQELLLGFGAHLDARIGVLRALTELNQFAVMLRFNQTDANSTAESVVLHEWLSTATLEGQPYLQPDATAAPASPSRYPRPWSNDVRDDVRWCQQVVERRGMEMMVLDQTRPDIGLSVAKVIVPGMRHFWARFAPGRLYEVPVTMGWLERPLSEDQLNPIVMFL